MAVPLDAVNNDPKISSFIARAVVHFSEFPRALRYFNPEHNTRQGGHVKM